MKRRDWFCPCSRAGGSVASLTTSNVAAQDEPGGGGRRAAATPPKPGAPEPIVGGIRPPVIGPSAACRPDIR